MSYGSVCSGIEAASVAWEPLGMTPAWFSEIEAFPSAVLAHHWPDVQNLGDMTKISRRILLGEIEAPDVLVGGTPCQAFSVAGMREGMADERGQLTMKYVELANAIDTVRARAGNPEAIIVWENVPGVLSDKSNAFGCFLGALAGEDRELQPSGKKWTNAGCVYGPQRAVAWRVLDAQYFGVAQRRRRVFVVASARTDIDPAAVLFEPEGLRRDTPPSREQGEGFAADVAPCFTSSRLQRIGDTRGQDAVVATPYQHVSHCLNAGGMGRIDYETESFVCQAATGDIAHTLNTANNGKGFSEDGTGRGVPTIAFSSKDYGADAMADCSPTLRAGGHADSHANAGVPPAVICVHGSQDPCVSNETAFALGRNSGQENAVYRGLAVRRLTPLECELLQGFPPGHTSIPTAKRNWHRELEEMRDYLRRTHQEATDDELIRLAADGPRYKAIGNSMAVPCMAWIGRRIQGVIA